MFSDHIEGKAQNTRTARASNFGDDVKSKRSASQRSKGKKKGAQSQSGIDEDGDDTKSQKSRRADQETADQINKELENVKFEIPSSCFYSFSKHSRIEKFDQKYILVVHPTPVFEGEMLLVQPKKEDQSDKDTIVFRDYSLRKRLPCKPKPELTAGEKLKEKKKKETEISKLQCLEIALDEPLCSIEWVHVAEVLNSVNGMCWFQVLPVGMKASQPLQFNTIHFLPESKYPIDILPIETFIKNHESNERKTERRVPKEEIELMNMQDKSARREFELNAKS